MFYLSLIKQGFICLVCTLFCSYFNRILLSIFLPIVHRIGASCSSFFLFSSFTNDYVLFSIIATELGFISNRIPYLDLIVSFHNRIQLSYLAYRLTIGFCAFIGQDLFDTDSVKTETIVQRDFSLLSLWSLQLFTFCISCLVDFQCISKYCRHQNNLPMCGLSHFNTTVRPYDLIVLAKSRCLIHNRRSRSDFSQRQSIL